MGADSVLIKFNLNPNWKKKFLEAGVPEKTPDESALEMKHMFHSLEHGRDPYEVRQEKADSGIPVFGKDGARHVSLSGLFQELKKAGYGVNGIHIRTREEKFSVLVIPFILKSEESLTSQVASLIEEFIGVCWGYAHVWVNPPQSETGAIIHTVNLSHREIDKAPEKTLHLNGGEWKTS